MKTLVIFDFDGTLTTKDTLLQFLKFYSGTFNFWVGIILLSPILIAYKLKLIPNWRAKAWVLKYFIGGVKLEEFNNKCRVYANNKINKVLRAEAYEKLQWHKEQGHEIYVISASAENWIKPFTEKEGIGLIATRLQTVDQELSGDFDGKNCYGAEKLIRLQQKVDLLTYDEVFVYGDSRGDQEILDVATHKFYRKF